MSASDYIEQLGVLELIQAAHTVDVELTHAWGIRIGHKRHIVPAGMMTDGASIPRLFWRVMDPPMHSLLFMPGVLHDGGYGGLLLVEDLLTLHREWVTDREYIDDLFRTLIVWNGAPEWRATAAWKAVRMFGGSAWTASHAENAGLAPATLDYTIPTVTVPTPIP